MVTSLFKLLIIQMTIQLTLATALEGRTAHYVELLKTTSSDATDHILTCPVYSIRPANQTVKFYKHIVSENQFNKTDDWTLKNDTETFADCASVAASDGYNMFLFDDNECSVSSFLYTRLDEPCGDETATVVYMVEASTSACSRNEFFLTQLPGPPCGSSLSPDFPVTCPNDKDFYKYVVSQDQFTKVTDWILKDDFKTFDDCSSEAASDGKTMFMFDGNQCKYSLSIFARLNESCPDDTATVVYMNKPPETSCTGDYLMIDNGVVFTGSFCGSPDDSTVTCTDGDLTADGTDDQTYTMENGECIIVG